jgi:hypothetical protein
MKSKSWKNVAGNKLSVADLMVAHFYFSFVHLKNPLQAEIKAVFEQNPCVFKVV